jgi:hypothetical protein
MSPQTTPLVLLGKWKATVQNPPAGIPMPRNIALSFERRDDGIHYSADGELPDGQTAHTHAVVQIDGRPYPLTGSPFGDAISIQQTSPTSFEARVTRAGAPSTRAVINATDPNRMTAQWEAQTPNGTVTWTSVAVRQT